MATPFNIFPGPAHVPLTEFSESTHNHQHDSLLGINGDGIVHLSLPEYLSFLALITNEGTLLSSNGYFFHSSDGFIINPAIDTDINFESCDSNYFDSFDGYQINTF